jgi:transposase
VPHRPLLRGGGTGRHVLYGYTPTHDGDAVDALVGGYRGVLLADAHSVYEHLYEDGTILKAGCWCHARRYYCKALDSDAGRARHALALIQKLFKLERDWKSCSPEERLRLRQVQSAPILETFFAWCDEEALKVLDATPISKAIGYSRNQREALSLFLTDGRIPIHNNFSENALRREALGRKNWMFLGNDNGGDVNATPVTLLASCRMHSLEPRDYLRDLLCLLPRWSTHRLLELAPLNWAATLARDDVQQQLADNIFRQVSLGTRGPDVNP